MGEWILGMGLTGVLLLYVAARLAWGARRARRRLEAVTSTSTTSCSQVGALAGTGEGGQRVECVGAARPGPGGTITAPYSGRPCVWHRSVTTHRYWGKLRTEPETAMVTKVESDTSSAWPILLVDSSGQVLVDVAGADRDLLCKAGFEDYHRFDQTGRSSEEGRHHHEWLIAPDQQVYVLGEAGLRDGWPIIARPRRGGGPLVVTTQSQEELTDTSRSDARTLRLLALALGGVAVALLVATVVLIVTG
jgi:hypothetical protein